MSKYACKVGKLNLAELLRLPAVKMPFFQRQYAWDSSNGKALAYVFDFLAASVDNNHLDYVLTFVHQPVGSQSSHFITFQDLHTVHHMFLTDGQHRMVTALMAAMALMDFLAQQNQAELRESLAVEVDYFENLLRTAQLEVCLRPLHSACLKETLQAFSKTLEDQLHADIAIKAEISAKRANVKSLPKAQRKEERTRLRAELERRLAATKTVRTTVQESSVWQSYTAIRTKFEELAAESNPKFLRLVMGLRQRFEQVSATIEVFMPARSDVSEDALTSHCFNLFTAKNGHSSPLTAVDLFIAYAGNKSDVEYPAIVPLIKGETMTRHPTLSSAFGIEDISTFLVARAIWDRHAYKEDARFGQIVDAFFRAPEHAAHSLAHYDSILTACQDASEWFRAPHISPTLQNLFQIYKDALAKNATYSLMLRFVKETSAGLGKPAEAQMLMLYKMLLLLEITQCHYEPGQSRASLARDVPQLDSPIMPNALKYCMAHFKATTTEQFKAKLSQHIQSYPFGKASRSLGKVLLFTTEHNPSRAIPFSENVYKNIAYEHVLPLNFEEAPLLSDAELQTLQDTMVTSTDATAMENEMAITLNLLGNAALLQRSANSELRDALPKQKLKVTEDKKFGSSWSPASLHDLRNAHDAAGGWDGHFIRQRSAALAEKLVAFLLDDAMLQLL